MVLDPVVGLSVVNSTMNRIRGLLRAMRASLSAAEHPQAWTIERTRQEWEDFDWTQVGNGELWSGAWAGSDALWTRTVFPRIPRYLHVERGLEVAPGFGRLTHHLRHRSRLDIVDFSPRCIEA